MKRFSSDARAAEIERRMTDDERFSLLIGVAGASDILPAPRDDRIPQDIPMSAGYTPGVPRLGVPAMLMTDASLGITNPGYRSGDTATAFPGSIALGASFNRKLAREAGKAIAREARLRGFNVLLGCGVNLARDPRNGRNFEYISEDPLHTALLAAEFINGAQREGVISVIKHYSLNCNETGRQGLDAIIDPAAHRESDLLAFEIAIERSQPGAVMAAYNKVNGEYACGNHPLLNDILKKRWGYKGWVMSDWGAVHHWDYALKGLDQESGVQYDRKNDGAEWFGEPLQKAYREGKLPQERLCDMVRRILRSMFVIGVDRRGPARAVDMSKHNGAALEIARQGIVLLKNENVLPLDGDAALRIAVIGGHADKGAPIGSGSSAVVPPGGYAAEIKIHNLYLLPSPPLEALKTLLPKACIQFDSGESAAEAAALARNSDIAVVFAIRVEGEGFDIADLSLPWNQDALIQTVAAANPNTVVVLETGNPVSMPWHKQVKGVVQAWYPGQAGGQAIAEALTGKMNPSGRLPITFPTDLTQTPRPKLPKSPEGMPVTIRYDEGAEVGYRWFARKQEKPLYSFGYGLSYTNFSYGNLKLSGGKTVTARFTVKNTGSRAGADVPQLYLLEAAGEKRLRLLGFERVELLPGKSREVTLSAEPRLLARYDGDRWRITEGRYRIAVGKSADDFVLTGSTALTSQRFGQ